jgi:hypothetical protein
MNKITNYISLRQANNLSTTNGYLLLEYYNELKRNAENILQELFSYDKLI